MAKEGIRIFEVVNIHTPYGTFIGGYQDVTEKHQQPQPVEAKREHTGNKYIRTIQDRYEPTTTAQVDVYCVLNAFNVTCPGLQHAIKETPLRRSSWVQGHGAGPMRGTGRIESSD